ncbi:MAG: hypothetical protein ACKVWR_22065 [Acidimicrobiales bacterium]
MASTDADWRRDADSSVRLVLPAAGGFAPVAAAAIDALAAIAVVDGPQAAALRVALAESMRLLLGAERPAAARAEGRLIIEYCLLDGALGIDLTLDDLTLDDLTLDDLTLDDTAARSARLGRESIEAFEQRVAPLVDTLRTDARAVRLAVRIT